MLTITQDQLLTEFTTWAERRDRCADRAVLTAFLDASAAHDPTSWQPGEVHTAVVGAVSLDPAILIGGTALLRGTLDSFFRFLRNTGRLRSTSDSATLRKEASRAVRTLEQALETVQLLGSSPADLAEEDEDWLDPEDPRYRIRGLLRSLGLAGSPRLPLPDLDEAAAEGLVSGYLERLFRLADQATGGVDQAGWMLPRPEESRRIAGELGVDQEDFMDLWLAAFIAGVIRLDDGSVVPGRTRAELAALPALRRLSIVSRAARGRLDDLLLDETGAAVVALLTWSLLDDRAWVPFSESVAWGAREDYWYDGPQATDSAMADLGRCVPVLVDAGVLEREGERARLTKFGAWVVDRWIDDQFTEDGRW